MFARKGMKMHELSLAQNIVDSIKENVEVEKLPLVRGVKMEIGAASGVVSDSLVFAFNAIVKNSPLSSAYMVAEVVPFIVHCSDCQIDTINETGFMVCGHCGSGSVSIVSGTELVLKQIELYDGSGTDYSEQPYH